MASQSTKEHSQLIDCVQLTARVAAYLALADRHLPELPGATATCQLQVEGRPELSWYIAFIDGKVAAAGVGTIEVVDVTLSMSPDSLARLMIDPRFDFMGEVLEGGIAYIDGSTEHLMHLSAIVGAPEWEDLIDASCDYEVSLSG